MPSEALASDVFKSLSEAKKRSGSSLTIGMRINGAIVTGDIIVQTPAYISVQELNVLD